MKTFATFTVSAGLIATLGCAENPQPKPAEPETVAQVQPAIPQPPTTPVTTKSPTAQIPKPDPAPVDPIKLPDDLGGKAVQKSLMPSIPALAAVPAPKIPRPRTSPLDQGEFPTAPVAIALLTSPNPKLKSSRPSAPPERAPTDLGQAAAENLSTVKFAEKPLVKVEGPVQAGAADMPMLARQLTERTPTDDPTAEISAAKLIDTAFPLLGGALPFLKQSIPDPFEFAQQLKGKLPRVTEFGLVPIVVTPERK